MSIIDFVEALSTDNLDAIKAAAKTDVHCHAFFSTRLENVERWIGHSLTKPPPKMNGLEGMMAYADAVLVSPIKHREGFEFVGVSAMNDAIQDGVVMLEMSFDIRLAEFYPDGVAGLCAFIETLAAQYREQADLRPELGFSRGNADDP
ncbi:MAG: hypothetical protein OXD49_08500, partial [Candidatus Poribacteria bacterium]|nr:hypothetical protein [Candidatus Poribacteria bacterium]